MKKVKGNLHYDWEGFLSSVPLASDNRSDMEYELREDRKKEIINMVVYEVDRFRNQSWWRRLFNLMPAHWIDIWLKGDEPEQYILKAVWHNVRHKFGIKSK